MTFIENLTEENYIIYAMKAYDNPSCQTIKEFREDLNRIKCIKKLISRYIRSGILKERLIINHIVVLRNVFGVETSIKLLFLKIDQKYYYILKTFLIFLSIMPDKIVGINGKIIYSSDIPLDPKIITILRKF